VTIIDPSSGGVNGPQVFGYPFNGPSVTSTLSHMTVRNAQRGINVERFNKVTLDHMRVTGNGPLSGAGVFNNSSELYVKHSLIDNNFATDDGSLNGCDWGGGSGGGIGGLCGGPVTRISDSTIADNRASRWGGGMILVNGDTTIENSTLSGNSAHHADPFLGGGAIFGGPVDIRYSTIANNSAVGTGGGVWGWGDGSMRLTATVLQNNTGGDCPTAPFFTEPVASHGFNVSADATCKLLATGDAMMTDAQLAPLALNGGATPTHALAYTSPAVDRVPAALCTVAADQDGVARPQHGACDSGASEHVFTAEELVTILAGDVVDVGPGGSLGAKVAAALAYLKQGQSGAACSTLKALGNEVRAQAGKKITVAQANDLLAAIAEIAATVGC
jgi:hypothetical protein